MFDRVLVLLMGNFPNGKDVSELTMIQETLMQIKGHTEDNLRLSQDLLDCINNNLGSLVRTVQELTETVAGRGMMPIESLKYILIFVCVFCFAMFFGVEALGGLAGLLKGN